MMMRGGFAILGCGAAAPLWILSKHANPPQQRCTPKFQKRKSCGEPPRPLVRSFPEN